MASLFVTGVGRGLGYALAAEFLERGHEVYGSTRASPCDLPLEGLFTIDMASELSIERGAAALASQTPSIDVLINCAGVDARAFDAADEARGPFDVGAQAFNAVFDVNVTGPMTLTKALLPQLRNGSDPLVLNISSQLGSMQVASSMGRDTAYCVSKAALNMWSVKAAAALESEGIAVVMMHPGWVQTDMGGTSAPLTMEAAAEAIATTTLDLSLADTGRFLRWDGGEHPW